MAHHFLGCGGGKLKLGKAIEIILTALGAVTGKVLDPVPKKFTSALAAQRPPNPGTPSCSVLPEASIDRFVQWSHYAWSEESVELRTWHIYSHLHILYPNATFGNGGQVSKPGCSRKMFGWRMPKVHGWKLIKTPERFQAGPRSCAKQLLQQVQDPSSGDHFHSNGE